MINIVIPMAGAGSRFSQKGYTKPKPFVEFHGKMMIEHVLEGLQIPDAVYTLIIQKEYETAHIEALQKIQNRFPASFFSVDGMTQGAACTALAAHHIINTNTPVLFADSDNIFQAHHIQAFIQDAKARQLHGSLLTVDSANAGFSYARLNDNAFVEEIKEKELISRHAITGAYYFADGRHFVDSAINMMIYGEKQKGEYYMSGTYNQAIKHGLKIGIYEISCDDYSCVGTPEQLTGYIKKQTYKTSTPETDRA